MILSLLTLLLVVLIVEGFVRVVRYFADWLRQGRELGTEEVFEARRAEEAAERVVERDPGGAGGGAASRRRAIARRMERDATEAYLDEMHLGFYQVIIVFFLGCIGGLFVEEVWMFVTAGLTQSRVGLVWGPFSPLYGFGATFLTLICFEMRRHHARGWQIFLISMAVGGVLEQVTGWSMDALFNAESWTYEYLPDHITQWVAWRFLFFWGLLGLAWCRVVMPSLLYRIGMPTSHRQLLFVILVSAYLVADIWMTLACFNRKTARDAGAPAANAFEQWVDEHYSDEFIANRFQNLVIGGDGQ